MKGQITLGSLFSGSGGFELAGMLAGITPVWNSEIEPYPILVTHNRLPDVQHFGDVSKLNGAELPPVDIVTFGSPCQDMSVAGKRNGLDGSRSGLFHEAVRIIREMRCATNGKYPRFIVWENVEGAYSSNNGEDFRTVLEEICQTKESDIFIPRPPERWTKAGEIMGENFSVAWRMLDAQYFGVPQRRKRIYLVADFAGQCAGNILFESEGLSGYSAESLRAWQGTACRAEKGSRTAGENICLCENHPADSKIRISENNICQALTSRMGTGGGNVPLLMETPKVYGICAKHSNAMLSDNPHSGFYEAETSRTLDTSNQSPCKNQGGMVVIEENNCNVAHSAQNHYSTSKTSHHTVASHEKANALVASDWKDPPVVNDAPNNEPAYIVRRLTPTECARLQGFPDWWCSDLSSENPTEEEVSDWAEIFEAHRNIVSPDKKPKSRSSIIKWLKNPHSDSAEYKMWGNAVALPCAYFVLSGIVYYAISF